MVLVDTLNTLKMTNGDAHNIKITTKRSLMYRKPNVFERAWRFFYDNDTEGKNAQ